MSTNEVTLFPYQQKAVESVLEGVGTRSGLLGALRSRKRLNVLLKAPTGSGKTLMLEKILDAVADDSLGAVSAPYSVAVVFLAPLRLHEQARAKFFDYGTKWNSISIGDVTSPTSFGVGDILFTNYSSVNKAGNVSRMKNERGTDIETVFETLRERNEDVRVLLVVDEVHNSFNAPKSQEFVNIVNPDVVVGVSATPTPGNIASATGDNGLFVEVLPDDVVAQGMIVKSVEWGGDANVYDADYQKMKMGSLPVSAQYVYQGLRKREEIAKAFSDSGEDVNPLLFIQIGNDKLTDAGTVSGSGDDVDTKDEISALNEVLNAIREISYVDDNIDISDDEIGVWLASDKRELDGIGENDSKVKVLISKLAVSMGVDIPRISVMSMLRNNRSGALSQQSLGRGMRSPRQHHYDDDSLNSLYVYTGFTDIIDLVDSGVVTAPTKTGRLSPGWGWVSSLTFPNRVRKHVPSASVPMPEVLSAFTSALGETLPGSPSFHDGIDVGSYLDEVLAPGSGFKERLEALGFKHKGTGVGASIRVGTTSGIDDVVDIREHTVSRNLTNMNSDEVRARFNALALEGMGASIAHMDDIVDKVVRGAILRPVSAGNGRAYRFTNLIRDLVSRENSERFVDLWAETGKKLSENFDIAGKFDVVADDKPWSPSPTYPVPVDNRESPLSKTSPFGLYEINGVGVVGGALDSANEGDFVNRFPLFADSLEKELGIVDVKFYKEGRTASAAALAIPYTDGDGVTHLFYPDWWVFGVDAVGRRYALIIETKKEKPSATSDTTMKALALSSYVDAVNVDDVHISGAVFNYDGVRSTTKVQKVVITDGDGGRGPVDSWLRSVEDKIGDIGDIGDNGNKEEK